MKAGIKVTVNSDDPGIFGSSLLDDYEILRSYHGFTKEEFDQCNATAFDACFIPEKIKSQFRFS
jgi:adenosine deaminase